MPYATTLWEYAVQSIQERLQKTADLIESVRSGEDPLSIKKMRVASRRLRAALQVFTTEFPTKDFARFEREVKRVADALAEARDLDVIIETVESNAESIPQIERAWIDYFLQCLKSDRAKLQARVLSALEFAEKRDLAGRFEELAFIQHILRPDHAPPDVRPEAQEADDPADSSILSIVTGHARPELNGGSVDPIARNFAKSISDRMGELVSFEPIIEDSSKITELHKMRIAAKRIRYTMELYVPHAGERIAPFIERIKVIQELLGNIHDADVLIPKLCQCMNSLLEKSNKVAEMAGAYMADFAAAEGMVKLCRNKQAERDRAYRDFLCEWRKMRSEGYFDALWSAVNTGE